MPKIGQPGGEGGISTARIKWEYGFVIIVLSSFLAISGSHGKEIDRKTAQGFSAAQYLIDFDCLDGVVVDRQSGAVSLFGHRRDKKPLLRIPYFDYLATALECKTPGMNLEPAPEAYPFVDQIVDRCTQVVKDAVKEPFDNQMRLTKASAWLLLQGGVAVRSNLTHWQTLAAMLRATGKEDSADLMELMQECASAQPERSAAAYLELYKALGISVAFQDIEHRVNAGKLTAEQASDAFNPLYLRAIAQELGLDANRYVPAYHEGRLEGKSPKDTMTWLQHFHMESDVQSCFKKIRNKVLVDAQVMAAPPWIAQELLAPNAPQVLPKFYDLPRSSWAARTMYQADVLMKQFAYGAQIRKSVPKFHTYEEFMINTAGHEYRVHMGSRGNEEWVRMQILPGVFKLSESPDVDGIRFQDAPMKFVVHRVSHDAKGQLTDMQDSMENVRNAYAAELSAQYNELAQTFPTLWKLRECAKMIAVARWLESHGIRPELPSGERLTWTPPASIPFTISVNFSLDEARLQRGVSVFGGVTLAPQASWEFSKEPVAVPVDARKVELPNMSGAAKIRNSLSKASDVNEKVTLQVALAQELSNGGDAASAMREMDKALKLDPGRDVLWLLAAVTRGRNGELQAAQQALQEYVKRDPGNAAAKRLLDNMQKDLSRSENAPRVPISGDPSKIVGIGAVIAPFKWNAPSAKSVYANDERAPELVDVPMRPFKFASQRPAPMIPDYLALQPELKALQVRRNALVQEYQGAPAEKSVEIRKEIEKADRETLKVIKSYEVSSDNPDEQTEKKPEEINKTDFPTADPL